MLPIFLKTLPFFAIIALGYGAGRLRIFPPEATAWLTKFVFYVALSAMLFRLTVNLSFAEIWDPAFAAAYLAATGGLYALQFALSRLRGVSLAEATIEAQVGSIGNTGFLGIPMLAVLLGPSSNGPILMVLTIDMFVFSSLVTLLITAARSGRLTLGSIRTLALGLIRNPMLVSMVAGFAWAGIGLPVPAPMAETLTLLGGAATPCALFAIGASLAGRSAERLAVAGWLSFSKLILHPAAAALMALVVFPVAPAAAGAMIAAAALPVAGNIYILAQHYGVAPQRVSAAILISTACSILTVPLVIAWVAGT
ncbi:AEC family transporter [Xinfangfangia pollutisoli]|uniref:AEC family transporter n=1 Tax=Xinfangfangia pollutisoli TaxID=2865960 RepID=UPI001CD494E1|nr:AEC family transporter [Xinfangfangia pollutisoli]